MRGSFGPAGSAGSGQFGNLAFGPAKNAAYGSAVAGGGAKMAAGATGAGATGKVAAATGIAAVAAGAGGKLLSVLLLIIGIPLGLGVVIGGMLFSGKKKRKNWSHLLLHEGKCQWEK